MTAPTLYQPPKTTARTDIDLSKNEGHGSDQAFEIPGDSVARYPDVGGLTDRLADLMGVDPSSILVTAGGDDGLARCFQAFAGQEVVSTTPSFEMIPRYAAQNRSNLTEIEWWAGSFPLEEFTSVPAGLAVVVSPNNPTGSVMDEGDLRAVADSFEVVVLDAAYEEFTSNPLTPLALDLENVLVVRTLSKAYGMAGLRVGYVLGSPSLITTIARYGSPYAVASPSARIAERRLVNGLADTAETITLRTDLEALLSEMGLEVLDSEANFVLIRGVDAERLARWLASLGIAVRSFPDRGELAGCVRITVPRTSEEMTRLESALRTIYRPEALLFDMDGVIADVSDSYRRAIVETASWFGVTVDQDDIESVKSEGNANDDWELTRLLCARRGVELSLDQVVEVFESIYQGTSETPGLKQRESLMISKEALQRLSDKLPLGIVTGRPKRDAEDLLGRFSLEALFDSVVTREDAPMKPDPAPVARALTDLGVRTAWLLGDTKDDLEAARGAGVLPIGVGGGALNGAAEVLATTGRIEEILNDTLS